jgi:hypothetical protein
MEASIDRVMKTYGMMVNLTRHQEQTVRKIVSKFLEARPETDEQKLAIEGLRYIRGMSTLSRPFLICQRGGRALRASVDVGGAAQKPSPQGLPDWRP